MNIMDMVQNFDDIRPFNDSEVSAALLKLSKEPQLIAILKKLFPQRSKEELSHLLTTFQSVREFQIKLIRTLVQKVISGTTSGVSISGLESINNERNRLFISNHRDIILDASFLNVLLVDKGFDTCEIAIGDNLFVAPWVETLVRINKNIVVKRNVPVRQMMDVSAKLSAYIRYSIAEKKNSVWIAQREGRAKDSNDVTQESLLKMLNISGTSTLIEDMKALNITPVSISYEYDPCDYLKAKEFQQKRDNPEYKKTKEDDQLNMLTGIQGWKGKVQYVVSPIGNEIDNLPAGNRNEQLTALARLIDKHIHKNYRIYPCNKVAYDLFTGTSTFVGEYSREEKDKFEQYLQRQIDKIKLENKDVPFLQQRILEMYANPLINYLKANQ